MNKSKYNSFFGKAILVIALLFFNAILFAQTGVLKGVVRDDFGDPLPEADVELLGAQPRKVIQTDFNGKYLFELPVGTHRIKADYPLLQSDTIEVTILENQVVEQDFQLFEQKNELDVVVVSAGKFEQSLEDLTVSMEVLKPDLIENKNTASIETALEQAPGLTILDGEPQIRGGSGFTFGVGSRVSIVVDGMPMLSGDAGRPEWSFVPVENIEQVEVIKGASSVLYGSSALSGVIHIRTRYPRLQPETKVIVNSGLYSQPSTAERWSFAVPLFGGLSFLHSRIVKKKLDVVVGGNFYTDHGYIGPPKIEDPRIVDTLTNFSNRDLWKTRGRINFNLRYRPAKIEGLNFGMNGNMMVSKTNFALAWLNDTTGRYRAYPGAISLQDQVIFNFDPYVNYYTKTGVKHSIRTRVLHANNEITNNQSNESTLWYSEYQIQRKFPFVPDLNFTGGAVANLSNSNSELYSGSGSANNKIVNFSGYSQLDKKMWKVLNISAGLRFEYFKMNNVESVVQPVFRMGASLRVTEGTTFRYSYGQGFRFPTITERFILTDLGAFGVFPNSGLQPETSTNSEIGIKQGFKIGKVVGYLDIAGFHQEYQNTIEYLFGLWGKNWPVFGFKFLNTGNTRVRGLDISLMGKAEISKESEVTFLAGYTYVLPIALDPTTVYARDSAAGGSREFSFRNTSMDTTTNILKYRFQHTGKINIDWSYKQFSAGFSGRYYSYIRNIDRAFKNLEVLTQFTPFESNIYYLDYWNAHKHGIVIFDARIGYELNDKMKLGLVVNNVANKEYALRPMKIESPRTTALQYVYKF